MKFDAIVFDLDGTITRSAPGIMVAQKVQRVYALIDQGAAALGVPAAPPGALGIVGRRAVPADHGARAHQLSGLAAVDQALQLHGGGVVAVLKDHVQRAFGGVGDAYHFQRVVYLRCHGLFGKHVPARLQRGDGHGRVEIVGREHVHDVDVIAPQKLFPESE